MQGTPKFDRMSKLGLRTHPDRLNDDVTGAKRTDIRVLARRARKTWKCAAGLGCCGQKQEIFPEDVYIEYITSWATFEGEIYRYHIECALDKHIVQSHAEAAEKGLGTRRQAIEAQRSRKETSANKTNL